jgi:hypothetical protein
LQINWDLNLTEENCIRVSSDEQLEWAYARYLQATYIEVMSRKAMDQTKKVIKLYERTPLHGLPEE